MARSEAAFEILRAAYPTDVVAVEMGGVHPHITLKPARWHEIARFLRDDSRLGVNWLRCISAIDQIEDRRFVLMYEFHAIVSPAEGELAALASNPGEPAVIRERRGFWHVRHQFAIRIAIERDHPHIASVADVWPAANWHEREAFDLFGIVFDGHPDLRRILCCDDWVGFPLRKDYEFPREYHGIPGSTEFAQSRIEH